MVCISVRGCVGSLHIGGADQMIQASQINSMISQTTISSDSIPHQSQPIKTEEEVSKAKQVKISSDENTSVSISQDGDIMEISQEGLSLAMNMSSGASQGSDTSSAKDSSEMSSGDTRNSETSTSGLEAQASATQENNQSAIASIASSTVEEDDTDTSDLSSYSAYELSQMVSEGSISASEYSAELKRREVDNQGQAQETEKVQVADALQKMNKMEQESEKQIEAVVRQQIDPTSAKFQLDV